MSLIQRTALRLAQMAHSYLLGVTLQFIYSMSPDQGETTLQSKHSSENKMVNLVLFLQYHLLQIILDSWLWVRILA